MFLARVRTGFILLFAGILFLSISHIPAVLLLVLSGISALAMAELAEPMGMKKPVMAVGGAALCLFACHIDPFWMALILGVLFCAYLLTGWFMMTGLPGKKEFRLRERLLMIAAVPMFIGTAGQLRLGDQGLLTLVLPILTCAATDTFAFFVGRSCGKHSLAPIVSPKKTLEGALGGGILATVMLLALGVALNFSGWLKVRLGRLFLYALSASAVGQFGDLYMSAVKRVAGIKDFSDVLPGHGGILDRLDSCLLALPFTYLFIGCFGPIFG